MIIFVFGVYEMISIMDEFRKIVKIDDKTRLEYLRKKLLKEYRETHSLEAIILLGVLETFYLGEKPDEVVYEEVEKNLADVLRIAEEVNDPYILAFIGQALYYIGSSGWDYCLWNIGSIDRGLEILEEVSKIVSDSRIRSWLSEAYYHKALYLAFVSNDKWNAKYFVEKAIEIAEKVPKNEGNLRMYCSLKKDLEVY